MNYQDLALEIKRDFITGATSNEKLPSLREIALHYSVSRSMVTRAYEILMAQKLVELRNRQGYFRSVSSFDSQNRFEVSITVDQSVEPSQYGHGVLLNGKIDETEELVVTSNYSRARWQYHVSRSFRHINTSPKEEVKYALAEYLCRHGWTVNPKQVFLFWGTYQPFDLTCRLILNENSSVVFFDTPPQQVVNITRSYGAEEIIVEPSSSLTLTENVGLSYALPGYNPHTGKNLFIKECTSIAAKFNSFLVQDIRYEQVALVHESTGAKFFDSQCTILWGSFGFILGDVAPISFLVIPESLSEYFDMALKVNPACIPEQYVASLSVMLRNGQLEKLIERQRKSFLKIRQKLIYSFSTKVAGFARKIDKIPSVLLSIECGSQFANEVIREAAESAGLPIILNTASRQLTIPLNRLEGKDIDTIIESFVSSLYRGSILEARATDATILTSFPISGAMDILQTA